MGLRKEDLKHTIYDIFEIDSFSSKMGEDEDIVVVSFSMRDKGPAEDLVKFLESGYSFILDADVTPGEQRDGTYKVFVEMERSNDVATNVFEIIDGVKKISGLDKLKFRYYKNFNSNEATLENLNTSIPKSSIDYKRNKEETKLENYKHFFNKSYVDSIDLLENTLTIKKIYADPLHFKFIDFGDKETILENINEKFNTDDFAEIIYLCKYIGDYNITKYGDKITMENSGKTLVLERIS
tara:strand:- start:1365 stop:2081 length:717 start_codon:yes stop_codon:yes gene_type:complete